MIFDILHNTYDGDPPSDKRKYNRPSSECSIETHDLVNTHIELFHPTISHYRREHAPNVRYLPSDINIILMHSDFIEKYPNIQISYEFYRLKVKEKIFHSQPLAMKSVKYANHLNYTTILRKICNQIVKYVQPKKNTLFCYTNSRALYQQHAEKSSKPTHDSDTVYYSADLQKIIILPRVDCFKKVIFVRRLTAYNESFVPLGEKCKQNTVSCIWHEAISRRNK